MPIYGFECHACGHRFDRLQKLSDPDPDTCPSCHAKALRRQLSAPSFRLSGSGWYETDFKKDGEKKHNLAEKGEGGAAPEKGDAKTDGKGDGKAAAANSDAKPASSEAKPSAGSEAAKPAPKAEPKPASPPAAS
ncbi:MAG: zinc ribbon domain-containing protein [Proteobacteria bacterium]|nr:zinc ribbon domain-containing protein [Pseudomonadota bacterium]